MMIMNWIKRAPVLAFAVMASVVNAHPGHSHFGSADEPPSVGFIIWITVILGLATFGIWRLFCVFVLKRNKTMDETTKDS
ncbi:hypothetical protein EOL70_03050 [Leucothrix sargassi]|nr:hypothetical protein EOL70_03050 [Leucothrix sargassi]